MAQKESRLSQKIMTELRQHGAFVFKVWGNDQMLAGLPDIICCYQGHFYGFETKMPGKRQHTSARQDYVHELIRNSGGVAVVVTSVQEALDIMLMAWGGEEGNHEAPVGSDLGSEEV